MGLKNVLTPKIFWSTKFGTLKLCNKNILFDIFTPKNYGRKIFSAPEFLDTKNFYVWKYILLRATALLFLAWFINWLLTQLSHWVTKKILQAYLTKKPSILVNLKKKIGLWFQTPSWYSKYLVPKRFFWPEPNLKKAQQSLKRAKKGPWNLKDYRAIFPNQSS